MVDVSFGREELAIMKTVLCKVCQSTGVLCPSCERKLRSGEISKLDIEISIFLNKETRNKKEFNDVHFRKAFYVDDYLVLVFKKGDLRIMLSYGKRIIKNLERKFGKRVYLVEDHPNFREFIESLLYPAPLEAINIIWLPDGTKETRIVLSRKLNKEREELIKKIIREMKGIDVKIGYI